MSVLETVSDWHAELTSWRRELHAYPETAFEEHRTSGFVAEKLEGFGFETQRGLAGTGVVGTLKRGAEGKAVSLRAELDALPMQEKNEFAHRSRHPGKMHACGHDGHIVMLLAAARYLAAAGEFDGTVHCIFQPAEEAGGGANVMLEQGLLERHPMDAVFALHNMPGLQVGTFGLRSGPMLASADFFRVRVKGKGAHAAFPHHGIDPILITSAIVTAVQGIASRFVDPLEPVVVTVARIAGGEALNVIPEECEFGGTVRCFNPEVRDLVEQQFRSIVSGIAGAFGASAYIDYERHYPSTVNSAAETRLAAAVAESLVGADNVLTDIRPSMAADDLSYLLQRRPGAMVLIGNGVEKGGEMVHKPTYDFNDEILPLGAAFLAGTALTYLDPTSPAGPGPSRLGPGMWRAQP